ncbi:MAG: S9 family peptidase [Alicyclobacillus sp.]|nr:S9 family peptidase [Alicyclobacillus sp.]
MELGTAGSSGHWTQGPIGNGPQATAGGATDAGKPYFTVEDMVSLPAFEQVAVHPDGQRAAFVVRRADWDEDQYVSQVFVYDVASHDVVNLTPDAVGGSQPQWSPDGRWLGYLRTVGEGEARKLQVFVKSRNEAVGVPVTRHPEGVFAFRFSADGRTVFFTAVRPQPERAERDQRYGTFEYVDVDDRRRALYRVDLAVESARRETRYERPRDLRDDTRQPDGGKADGSAGLVFDRPDLHVLDFDLAGIDALVFTAAPSTNFEDFQQYRLYRMNLRTGGLTELQVPGPIGAVVRVSPDEQQCVFTRTSGDGKMFRNHELWVYHFQDGTVRPLPLEIDENVHPVVWTQRGLVVEWQDRLQTKVELVQADGVRQPLPSAGTTEGRLVRGASVTPDGCFAAWLEAGVGEPWDVYVGGDGLDKRRVTQALELFTAHTTSRKHVVRWHASDGVEVEGVLSLPPDFDGSQPHPLLVVVHGGPTAASLPVATTGKYYPIEQFVERGCIVLEPNYRGSSGYGGDFRGLNEGNLGLGDYDDVISGVDALIARGWADAARVGVMGWSQGGYISAFCATYSDRFKAASVGAGISDWMTYYVNTDIHPFTRHYLGATPWEDGAVYARTSPITYVRNAQTPTLIQHGDADARVPVPNAFELYQGLRDVGVPVQLVIFKGMQHGSNKPSWNRAILRQNEAWFAHHVLGHPLDDFWLDGGGAKI